VDVVLVVDDLGDASGGGGLEAELVADLVEGKVGGGQEMGQAVAAGRAARARVVGLLALGRQGVGHGDLVAEEQAAGEAEDELAPALAELGAAEADDIVAAFAGEGGRRGDVEGGLIGREGQVEQVGPVGRRQGIEEGFGRLIAGGTEPAPAEEASGAEGGVGGRRRGRVGV
jgi:hypothetical protein